MNGDQDRDFEAQALERLEALREVPPRPVEAAVRGRENFLAQARSLAPAATGSALQPLAPGVSASPLLRLKGWISRTFNPPVRKERFSMSTALAAILISITLIFGGAGATVYAAQDSLPQDSLYPLKTLSEDFRLGLALSTQREFNLAVDFSDRRIEETISLALRGDSIPNQVLSRLQNQQGLALQLLAQMEDGEMRQDLERYESRIQKQERLLERIQNGLAGQAAAVMAQVREMVREQQRLVVLGLQDPQQFREQVRSRLRDGFGGPSQESPGSPQESPVASPGGYGPGPASATPGCASCGAGPGPQVGTPQPGEGGAGYGPGPGNAGATAQPTQGYGPGPDPSGATSQPQDAFGPGPGGGGATPQPKDGDGPGPANRGAPSQPGGESGSAVGSSAGETATQLPGAGQAGSNSGGPSGSGPAQP